MHKKILITPTPRYLPEHSNPEDGLYAFAYTITIENQGLTKAQLISRHWVITDRDNAVQEVRGLGVIGEQPVLLPGGSFSYTSGCTLPTPVGTMKGSYLFIGDSGEQFEVLIPEFVLAMRSCLH